MEDGIWIKKDKLIIDVERLTQYTTKLKLFNKEDKEIYCGDLKEEIKLDTFYIDDIITIFVESSSKQWLKYGQIRRKKDISLKRISKYIKEFGIKTEGLINECK